MGLRQRILLPFLVLFAVAFVVTAAVSIFLIAGAVERRLASQTADLARVMSGHPEWYGGKLGFIERAYGAKFAGVEPEGRYPAGPGVYRAPVAPELELVMVWSPEVISREKSEAVRPFLLMAGVGLLLVVVLGTLTAQTVARPLERLARQARSLPAGEVRPVGGGAELDHLVEAMNRMLAEVRRSERLVVMGQMAAGVAHEIRNPLSSMKMTVQMLRERSEADRESFDLLLREIERLELTAAELVGMSQPLRKEPVRLDRVVDEVLELMRRRLEHLGIRVERRYSSAPDVPVDVARFKRCVMNLLLNGAQAMPAGGGLTVGVAPRDGRVRLAVTDQGPGIPPEVRERIFEPFVTTKLDGVGLGLALTRRIVEDHGGSIGFDAGGTGTTFWIELPHG
jgi:signal transduction histidine kinase